MCMIIVQKAGKRWAEGWVRDLYEHNSEGIGVMYAENGELHTEKFVPKSHKDVLALLERLRDKGLAIHYRMRTSGDVNKDNAHPFEILNKKEHGISLAVMHNGVLDIGMDRPGMNDTWHYCRDVLKPLLCAHPGLLQGKAFQGLLADHIGVHNKLVFMDHLGRVTVINEAQGAEFQGCWISNTYAISWHRRGEADPGPGPGPVSAPKWQDGYDYDWPVRTVAPQQALGYWDTLTVAEAARLSYFELEELVFEDPGLAARLLKDALDELKEYALKESVGF